MKKVRAAVTLTAALIVSACSAQPAVPPTIAPSPQPQAAKPTEAAKPTTAPAAAAPTSAPAAAPTSAPAAAAATQAPAVQGGIATRPFAKLSNAERGRIATAPPPMTVDRTKKYVATIVTSKGEIKVELDPSSAPQTVNNFVYLATNGFYDGLTFHRVEPGFVIQGGDPAGNGTGGPGYNVPPEIKLLHVDGAIAMARRGGPAESTPSSGSQFYITMGPQAGLDTQYTVFGRTISGQDVVRKIAIGDKIDRVDISEGTGVAVAAQPTVAPQPLPTPAPAACEVVPDAFQVSEPALAVVADDHAQGKADALSTIIEYADMECPACAQLHPVLKATYNQISDTARLVFRHYPLTTIHPRAYQASLVVESAAAQGKLWAMMDVLYTKQAEWTQIAITDGAKLTDTFKTYARDLGLDMAKFDVALAAPETRARVDRDMKSGDGLQLPGTPTLFIDGRPLSSSALANPTFLEQYQSYVDVRREYLKYQATNPFKAAKPDAVTEAGALYQLTLKTSKGDVVVELDPKLAPTNVNSVVFLAQKGYFKSIPLELNDAEVGAVLFSDASGTGFGTPGYDCGAELPKAGAFDQAGVVALYGDDTRSGSQFVITYTPTQQFDQRFTVIGKVTGGLDIVKGLVPKNNPTNQTADRIESATVAKK